MFGGEGRARETVTETIRQTITVNGAGSQGAFNATATETVTVPVNVASSAVEDDEGGQRNADEFEG